MKRWAPIARSGFAALAGKKNFPFQSLFNGQGCLILASFFFFFFFLFFFCRFYRP